MELVVLDAADVAVDHAAMVFLAERLGALREAERVGHLQPLEGLDCALVVALLLPAARFNGLLERE